jgi:hypothetical protein
MGIQRAALAVGASVAVLATLAGCASAAPPLPEPATAAEIEALRNEQARMWWDSMASGEPMPEIDVIEVMPPDEAFMRQTECLAEANLPGVSVGSEGEWHYSGSAEFNDPDFMVVQQQFWACAQQYPSSGDRDHVLSQSELGWLHDYYAKRYLPCLASLGFESLAFPSRRTFIGEGAGYASWVPHDFSVIPVPTAQQWAMLAERCPLPYLLDGYGLPGQRPPQ